MKEITKEDSEEILRKQCSYVGVDPEKIIFTEKDWFTKYTWSKEQEQDFILWLADFLVKKKYCHRNRSLREARKIDMMVGWKTI